MYWSSFRRQAFPRLRGDGRLCQNLQINRNRFMVGLSTLDMIAFGWFLLAWTIHAVIVERSEWRKQSLNYRMDLVRIDWMRQMLLRELKTASSIPRSPPHSTKTRRSSPPPPCSRSAAYWRCCARPTKSWRSSARCPSPYRSARLAYSAAQGRRAAGHFRLCVF